MPIRTAFDSLYDELCGPVRPRTLQTQIGKVAERRPDECPGVGADDGPLVGLPGTQLTVGFTEIADYAGNVALQGRVSLMLRAERRSCPPVEAIRDST